MPGLGVMVRKCTTPASALNEPRGNWGNAANSTPLTAAQGSNRPLTFPPWPWTKTGQYEDGPMDRPTRSDPSCPILKPRPNCPPSGAVQWGTHHCWWEEGDHIDWLRDMGLECELQVLWMDEPEGPPSREAARARGYWRLSHPILRMCRSRLTDCRYKGLQGRCLVAGHTNCNLFQEGTSNGVVQDYWLGDGNDHDRGTSKGNCNLETDTHCRYVPVVPAAPKRCKGGTGAVKGHSLWPLTLLCPRNSVWTMSRGMPVLHGVSPFLHLGPSVFMATHTSRNWGTALGGSIEMLTYFSRRKHGALS